MDRNGSPWFVAMDVCKATLHSNTTVAVGSLDPDEQTKLNLGGRVVNCVSESGLYSLILKSRKPEAKAFKKWVTSEVLPTIRKTGGLLGSHEAQDHYPLDGTGSTGPGTEAQHSYFNSELCPQRMG